MCLIVLRNLECLQMEEKLSEVINADEVMGGIDFNFGFTISNTNTKVSTTIRNVLNIDRDLPSLQTINQIAGASG
jgi:hypothetical protein